MILKNRCFGSIIAWTVAALGAASGADAGLVARWSFDETGGSTAHDSVGSVDGTLTNAASFAPGEGIAGGAVRIDLAGNGFVDMGDNFGLTGTSYTLQAWVKTDPGDTRPFMPVSKHRSTVVAGYFFLMNEPGPTTANKAYFYQAYPTTGPSSISVNDGDWHQLVAVSDVLAGTTSLYVDGLLQSTVPRVPLTPVSAHFLVGGVDFGGTPTGFYNGLIDEVRVYDSALTAAEVRELYTNPAAAVPEPATLASMGFGGLASMLFAALRRSARSSVKA